MMLRLGVHTESAGHLTDFNAAIFLGIVGNQIVQDRRQQRTQFDFLRLVFFVFAAGTARTVCFSGGFSWSFYRLWKRDSLFWLWLGFRRGFQRQQVLAQQCGHLVQRDGL